MITLYKQGAPQYTTNADGERVISGYKSTPVLFSDMFPLFSGLEFDFKEGTVKRNGQIYYFDNEESFGNLPSPSEWMSHAGNSVKYHYYTSSMAYFKKNPSGNTSNVKYIDYLTKNVLKYRIELEYDINDNPTIRRSLPTTEAVAGDTGNISDNEYIDSNDRLPLSRLNVVPFCKVDGAEGESFSLSENEKWVVVSQTNRSKPIYTDGLLMDSSVSSLNIQMQQNEDEPAYELVIFVIDNSGKITSRKSYSPKYRKVDTTIANSGEGNKYVVLSIMYEQSLDHYVKEQITQKALKLEITAKGFCDVTIKDALHPVAEPIRIPEGMATLADYLPANTESGFAGYVDADGESVDINTPTLLSGNITLTAVYNE